MIHDLRISMKLCDADNAGKTANAAQTHHDPERHVTVIVGKWCWEQSFGFGRAMDSDSSDDEYWGSYERLPQDGDASFKKLGKPVSLSRRCS